MSQLINEIVEAARLEDSATELQVSRLDLREVVQVALHALEPLRGNGHELVTVEPEPRLWKHLHAQPAGPHPRRARLIRSWVERPDFVSVNFSDGGVMELCSHLLRLGIGIEAGVWTVADAEALVDSGYSRQLVRVLVEPQDLEPVEAEASAAAIGAALDHAGVDAPRLYHGYGTATWRVIEFALDAGWDIRIGLEDTLQLPDATIASGNAELVAVAVQMARKSGRLPA